MERCVEQYLELYSAENTVSDEALNSISALTFMNDIDTEPSMADMEESRKVVKPQGMMPYYQKSSNKGKQVYCLCWKEG